MRLSNITLTSMFSSWSRKSIERRASSGASWTIPIMSYVWNSLRPNPMASLRHSMMSVSYPGVSISSISLYVSNIACVGNDNNLGLRLYNTCQKSPHFVSTHAHKNKHEFCIVHYAGPVVYSLVGFVVCCRAHSFFLSTHDIHL